MCDKRKFLASWFSAWRRKCKSAAQLSLNRPARLTDRPILRAYTCACLHFRLHSNDDLGNGVRDRLRQSPNNCPYEQGAPGVPGIYHYDWRVVPLHSIAVCCRWLNTILCYILCTTFTKIDVKREATIFSALQSSQLLVIVISPKPKSTGLYLSHYDEIACKTGFQANKRDMTAWNNWIS